MPGGYRFGRFELDPANRTFRRDGEPVELNSRYLDALALLVREQGRLVSKDRFLDEVWRGVPVTDEALTQCIKTLRQKLDDSASSPRFIETVPKHGYRFVAAIETGAPVIATAPGSWRDTLLLGAGGTIGGGMAGFVGGLTYGLGGATDPDQPIGAVSVLLVLLCVTILLALIGAAGVSFGIAIAQRWSARLWAVVAGGALGGLIVGAGTKLLGLDAFRLLVGQSPGDITGALEGVILGAAVGLAAWYSNKNASTRRAIAAAAGIGAAGGLAIALAGGRLMAGSLALLAANVPQSRLRLDQFGRLAGEAGLGPVAQTALTAMEAALFAACIIATLRLARSGLHAGRR